ncbi:hypothetical protein SUNI508_05653 [Seiridium unicorne]|uniref:Uncharacterized protein n=1 Tax=Seiridium unicorne TaxID=138068 RepID=A0ABR2V3D3_9PEZI
MSVNPNLSNGTCYYAESAETKGEFIPCGNSALGHWPCCYRGDSCLSFQDANACFDNPTGNTYFAGCTDPSFTDRACPQKSSLFDDQEWVAIQQCQTDTGSGNATWGGCKVSADSTELEVLPHSSCDPYCSSGIYSGSTSLPAYAALPNIAGGTISWEGGFNPTLVYTPATTTAERTAAEETTTSTETYRSATITQPPSTSSAIATVPVAADEGLSLGAKIGIGVGAAGAVLLVIAIILLTLLIRRRKTRTEASEYHPPLEQDQPVAASPYQPSSEPWLNGNISKPYVAFKSELPANERPVVSELPAY